MRNALARRSVWTLSFLDYLVKSIMTKQMFTEKLSTYNGQETKYEFLSLKIFGKNISVLLTHKKRIPWRS